MPGLFRRMMDPEEVGQAPLLLLEADSAGEEDVVDDGIEAVIVVTIIDRKATEGEISEHQVYLLDVTKKKYQDYR